MSYVAPLVIVASLLKSGEWFLSDPLKLVRFTCGLFHRCQQLRNPIPVHLLLVLDEVACCNVIMEGVQEYVTLTSGQED